MDVAQLHAALSDPAARGTVFEILERRGGPPGSARFTSLNDEYKRQWDTGLYVDSTAICAAARAPGPRRSSKAGRPPPPASSSRCSGARWGRGARVMRQAPRGHGAARGAARAAPAGVGRRPRQGPRGPRPIGDAGRSNGRRCRPGVGGSGDLARARRPRQGLRRRGDRAKVARLRSEKRITGTDIEQALIELARRRCWRTRWIRQKPPTSPADAAATRRTRARRRSAAPSRRLEPHGSR